MGPRVPWAPSQNLPAPWSAGLSCPPTLTGQGCPCAAASAPVRAPQASRGGPCARPVSARPMSSWPRVLWVGTPAPLTLGYHAALMPMANSAREPSSQQCAQDSRGEELCLGTISGGREQCLAPSYGRHDRCGGGACLPTSLGHCPGGLWSSKQGRFKAMLEARPLLPRTAVGCASQAPGKVTRPHRAGSHTDLVPSRRGQLHAAASGVRQSLTACS